MQIECLHIWAFALLAQWSEWMVKIQLKPSIDFYNRVLAELNCIVFGVCVQTMWFKVHTMYLLYSCICKQFFWCCSDRFCRRCCWSNNAIAKIYKWFLVLRLLTQTINNIDSANFNLQPLQFSLSLCLPIVFVFICLLTLENLIELIGSISGWIYFRTDNAKFD